MTCVLHGLTNLQLGLGYSVGNITLLTRQKTIITKVTGSVLEVYCEVRDNLSRLSKEPGVPF